QLHSNFSRFRLLPERGFAACAKRAYTGAMRTVWKQIRYRLELLGLKVATKFLPLLSRKACYRLALFLGSLSAVLDRRGRGGLPRKFFLGLCGGVFCPGRRGGV